MDFVRCVVDSVRVHEQTKQHAVILRDDAGRLMSMWIGADQAFSIASVLHSRPTERPTTHDLVRTLLDELGARLDRAVVKGWTPFASGAPGGTFLASVCVRTGDREVEIDCRPSDAIAIALHCGAPVLVTEEIIAREGKGTTAN